jgi:hypothetical protein
LGNPISKLKKKSVLLAPVDREYTECSEVRPLQLKDVTDFSLEDKMMMMPNHPMFLVYYCTPNAEVLGRFVISNTELIFEPLNHKFRGFYDYEGTSLDHTEGGNSGHSNMGTVISFDDIVLEDCRKVTINKPGEEESYLRISVNQTGN